MPTLSAARALALLDELAAEYPARVYDRGQTVHYVHDGEPDCIVGHVLVRAGWTVQEVEKLNTAAPFGRGTVSADILPRHLSGVEWEAADVLGLAQVEQDRHRPWSVAVAAVHDVLGA